MSIFFDTNHNAQPVRIELIQSCCLGYSLLPIVEISISFDKFVQCFGTAGSLFLDELEEI